jgi:hypothetical protein
MNQILLPLILLVTVNLVFIDMVLFSTPRPTTITTDVLVTSPQPTLVPSETPRVPTPTPKILYQPQDIHEAGEWYIPLGSSSVSQETWTKLPGAEAQIDTRSYPKNIRVTFEIFLSIPTANGVVSAKLYNETDQHDVWTSTVEAEGNATIKKTAVVSLDSGNKTYSVWAKSSLKYEARITNARIHIESP